MSQREFEDGFDDSQFINDCPEVAPGGSGEPNESEMEAPVTRDCFVCGNALIGTCSNSYIQEFREAAWGSTVFTAYGNFGSTVFDPSPGEQRVGLEISICCDCLKGRAERVLEFNKVRVEHKHTASPWNYGVKQRCP